jgi:leader peptidase (prepilin peptidase)/N-methyltransferase
LELIPILSWIIQRRRCRSCGATLSSFYPIIELAAAVIAVSVGLTTDGPWIIAGCAAGWLFLAFAAWQWCRFHPESRL